jgi:branched-chain amino acid transport system substrate-binding protein
MVMRFRTGVTLLSMGLGCLACSKAPRVGVVLPETGPAAMYGASLKSGISLAFSQLGTVQGEAVEVLYRDSGSDPARAASACEAIYEQGASVIIGGATSAEAKSMIPVADRFKRVLLSPSASAPDLGRRSSNFLRVFPSDELEGREAAEFLVGQQHTHSVLILREDNDYARGLLPVFVARLQALGAEVLGPESLDESGWEQRVRQAVADQNPESAYICGYGEAITRGLLVLRAAGFHGPVCATSAIHSTSLLQRLGREAEGLYFPLATADLGGAGEPARRFIAAYRQTYNMDPDIYACYGHDAALATVTALRAVPSPGPANMAAALRELRGVRGVMGPVVLDAAGALHHTLKTHWIRGGRVEVAPSGATPTAARAPRSPR